MKARLLFFICMCSVWSCNQVNIPDTIDPNQEPTAAVEVVKDRFPAAENLVFKTILTGNIWEVDFKSGADKYTSLVDQTKMWETYRANPDSMPELMTDLFSGSPFVGGTFSGNSEDVALYSTSERQNSLIYNFKNVDYRFLWRRYQGTNYRPTNVTFEQFKYNIQPSSLQTFPAPIRDYLAARKELAFQAGQIRVKLNYEKLYWIQVIFKRDGMDLVGFLILDEKGVLKWASRDFNPNGTSAFVETLPAPIQQQLDQATELGGMKFMSPEYDKCRGVYEGTTGYYLKLTSTDYSKVCELYFDQDGNLLNKRYFVSF